MITLDKEDIINIWELNGDRHSEEPFKSIRPFINYYKTANPNEYIPDMFEYNYSNRRGGKKTDLLLDFAESFSGKIKIDEHFLRLTNNLPKDTKSSNLIKLFKNLNDKHPNFFKELTDAMNEKNTILYHEDATISAWLSLAKKTKANFKGQNIFHFMSDNFNEKTKTTLSKIDFLNNFDLEKTIPVLELMLKNNENNPTTIDAIANYFDKNKISHDKKEISIFQVNEQQLFHYDMKFQPEGVMQKLKVKENEARNILIWASYYLAEEAYYMPSRERTNGEEKNNHNREIKLSLTTPYKFALDEAKPIYEEALYVLFNSDFLNTERLSIINKDRYNEKLAKEFKQFIKPFKLKEELSKQLESKQENTPKIKI